MADLPARRAGPLRRSPAPPPAAPPPALAAAPSPARGSPSFGAALKAWRRARRVSQMSLALKAGVSTRHLSFLETGRARPSAAMIGALAAALGIPPAEQTALHALAGHGSGRPRGTIGDDERRRIGRVVAFMLARFEPYPAFVIDRCWNVVAANPPTRALFDAYGKSLAVVPGRAPNIMRMIFHPDGMRRHVANWPVMGRHFIDRLHRAAEGRPWDLAVRALLDEILAYPGLPRTWFQPAAKPETPVLVPIALLSPAGDTIDLFATYATIGSVADAAFDDLLVEFVVPADDVSGATLAALIA